MDGVVIETASEWPTGLGFENFISAGNTGMVLLDEATQTVVKIPAAEWSPPAMQRERDIYQRLSSRGAHPGILTYHGEFEKGFRLEYAPNGDLYQFLQSKRFHEKQHLRIQWMLQAAEALGFIHDAGIIHGDLTTHNMFLDADLNLKIGDFAGSSLDSNKLLVGVTESHLHPTDPNSVQGDLFACASAMYEIFTGQKPYASLSDPEITQRYRDKDFPETQALGQVGRIIRNCWEGCYSNSESLAQDIRKLDQTEPSRDWRVMLPQRWLLKFATARPRLPLVVLYTVGAVALGFSFYRRAVLPAPPIETLRGDYLTGCGRESTSPGLSHHNAAASTGFTIGRASPGHHTPREGFGGNTTTAELRPTGWRLGTNSSKRAALCAMVRPLIESSATSRAACLKDSSPLKILWM
ncbi:hypothetical protein E4U42_003155 [Claviceps africana]|uniref:EKC/KEOPS complex subunit BUD32 n=1 Tax=Claviceps africana TaxID=83212 RepID=A0A8K0J7T2_9HYPO|nr:hypothetical protein E4U42_003155 [Claviceps africana]